MITYVTGDLLQSEAQCLVNTVNCEGYMGKGIAYQFKLAFPENNIDYVKACKAGKLHIGTLHYYYEKGKRSGICRFGIAYEYVADCFNGLWKVREWRQFFR